MATFESFSVFFFALNFSEVDDFPDVRRMSGHVVAGGFGLQWKQLSPQSLLAKP